MGQLVAESSSYYSDIPYIKFYSSERLLLNSYPTLVLLFKKLAWKSVIFSV